AQEGAPWRREKGERSRDQAQRGWLDRSGFLTADHADDTALFDHGLRGIQSASSTSPTFDAAHKNKLLLEMRPSACSARPRFVSCANLTSGLRLLTSFIPIPEFHRRQSEDNPRSGCR